MKNNIKTALVTGGARGIGEAICRALSREGFYLYIHCNQSAEAAKSAFEAIKYYGGSVAGVASIFATSETCDDYEVNSVFNPNDLPDYFSVPSHECPLCKEGKKLDALINCHGYSKL